jgi:hypothetical protein
LSPAVLIAAGLLAVWLVLDDLIVAFTGGESVIADFFQEFFGFDIQPVLVGIVDGFKNLLADLLSLAEGLFSGFVDIFSGIGDILSGNFADGFASIGSGFMELLNSMTGFVGKILGPIFDNILPDWAIKLLGTDSPGDVPDPSLGNAMQPGGSVTNNGSSSRVDQTVNMEIRTSDPERAGRAAADGLQRQLNDAHTQTLRRSH